MNAPLFDGVRASFEGARLALAIASMCDEDTTAQSLTKIFGEEISDEDALDLHNFVSGYAYALSKDTLARRWFDAWENDRAPVYRALRIDPAEFGAIYAVMPFRYMVIGGRHLIAAAYPCPRAFMPIDADHLCIEDVVLWDPVTDKAFLGGEDEGQSRLVGNINDPARHTLSARPAGLYASPRLFFQHWAQARAQWLALRTKAISQNWHAPVTECDEAPGSLIVGDLAQIAFTPSELPDEFECIGIDAREVNKAILKNARLPRALGGMRAVA